MADDKLELITEREIREAELQMTGRRPASATGFIGFVPATPPTSNGSASSTQSTTPSAEDK